MSVTIHAHSSKTPEARGSKVSAGAVEDATIGAIEAARLLAARELSAAYLRLTPGSHHACPWLVRRGARSAARSSNEAMTTPASPPPIDATIVMGSLGE